MDPSPGDVEIINIHLILRQGGLGEDFGFPQNLSFSPSPSQTIMSCPLGIKSALFYS